MELVTVELSGTSADVLHSLSQQLSPALAADPGGYRVAVPEIPEQVESGLKACAPRSHQGVAVLRGLPVDVDSVGSTPSSWTEVCPETTAEWTAQLLLLARALGRPIGWEGQQDGRLVHDIVPTRGEEHEQTGASSTVTLSPHNEDAFHPQRADLLLLASVRNPDRIPTQVASVRHARLADTDREVLCEPRLPILPDSSYTGDKGRESRMTGPPVATLWNAGDGLGLRYDPAYTPVAAGDSHYRSAYSRLGEELERTTFEVLLQAGDVLVLDNDLVVHGRRPFTARYDGTDRWLRRVSVRVPSRQRPTTTAEHGYGQRVLDPWAA